MERGLNERGEMVSGSQVLALQKRVEELEKALGRKALEVDVLKRRVLVQAESHLQNDCGDCAETLSGSAVIAITAGGRSERNLKEKASRKGKAYVDEFSCSGRYPSQVSTGSRGYLGNFGLVAESWH